MNWPFPDSPTTAVFTTAQILSGGDFIAVVLHDADDGAWQFLGARNTAASESEAQVVALGTIVRLDPTLEGVASLPLGWAAWRETPNSQWRRGPR